MNEVIKNMLERRSYRKFKEEQIPDELLEQILNVGLYAPNAGSGQRTKIIVVQNKELNLLLGKQNHKAMNLSFKKREPGFYVSKTQKSIIDDENIKNGFYDAPTVITIFSKKDNGYSIHDASMVAENMNLAAFSLGLGSCIIGRADQTFATEYGQNLLKEWEVDNYIPIIHLIIGYPIGEASGRARKEGRIKIVKQ